MEQSGWMDSSRHDLKTHNCQELLSLGAIPPCGEPLDGKSELLREVLQTMG